MTPAHALDARSGEPSRVNLRLLDWIWHIKGSVPLAPGQSVDDAFDRLDSLFREPGTTYERRGDTLTFSKRDQAAQDKMSVFDGGVLRVEEQGAQRVLHYRLASRALLYCFLAPLLFLAFAQITVGIGKLEGPSSDKSEKADKAKKDTVPTLHPIDQALGAPAPEKPKKDKKEEGDDKPSPTPAYVFAGIFAGLYLVGRVLEDRLVKRLFGRRIAGS